MKTPRAPKGWRFYFRKKSFQGRALDKQPYQSMYIVLWPNKETRNTIYACVVIELPASKDLIDAAKARCVFKLNEQLLIKPMIKDTVEEK